MAVVVNSYDWTIQQDGDALLICKNGHGYDEPCRWERYVPVPPGFVLVPVEPTETMKWAFEQAYSAKVSDICGPAPTEHPEDGGGPFGYGFRAMVKAAKQEGE